MAATTDRSTSGVRLSPSSRAKSNALVDLKGLMSNLESPKVPKANESAVTVTRSVAKSSKGSTDFKSTGKSGGTTKEDTSTPVHKAYPSPKLSADMETPAIDAYEDGEEEEASESCEDDSGKSHTADRSDPDDVGDAAEVDKALSSFMVKGKKHIKKM